MRPLVVLATDSREPSGVGEHMLTLATELRDRLDIVFACPGDAAGRALLRRAAELGCRIKAIEAEEPQHVTEWLHRSRASLLHIHAGIGWEGHGLARCGNAAGLPVVRTEHLPYLLTDPVQKAEYRAMLLLIDQRIAVSQNVYSSHAERDDGPLTLVQNGIPGLTGQKLSAEALQTLGITDGDQLLLTVARLTAQKGHSTLISALPTILAQQPRVKLLLVGRGPELRAIEQMVRDAGLEHAVRLLGQRDDVPDLLATADLFVLPSHFEGLPLALLEAMACGLPVVASSIGGTIEALGTDHPYFSPAGDCDALSATILQALDDPAASKSAAEAARHRFRERFTAGHMAANTAAVYEKALADRRTIA